MDAQHDHSTLPSSTDTAPDRADADRLVFVCACLSLAMVVLVVPRIGGHPVPTSRDAIRSVVDADSAPWWELTVLPQIGPAIAGEIVRYRESKRADVSERADESVRAGDSDDAGSRVFSRPRDLMRVRGIGPKTVERIKGDLDFGGD